MAIRLTAYPAQTQLTPMPFESLLKAGALQQERIDKADDTLNKLSEEFGKIKPIKQDVELTRNTLAEYRQKAADIVAKSNGNTAAMLPEIKNLVSEFNTDVAYGKLNAVMQRRAAQDASFKSQDEARQEFIKNNGEKGMSPEDYSLAQGVEYEQQEQLVQDPITGRWTTPSGTLYNAIGARNTPNISKQAVEYSKLITPETVTQLDPNLYNTNREGIYYNKETNQEYSFPEVRARLLSQALKADPVIQNYYTWKNTISGNGEAVARTYNDLASRNFVSQDAQGNPIQFDPSYVQELAEKSLYPDIYNVSEAIGTLTAVNKSKSGISFIKDFDSKVGVDTGVTPLNVPYEQTNPVQTTLNEINKGIPVRGMSLRDVPGRPKSAYSEFVGTETPKQKDPTKIYDEFSPITKARVDYVKAGIPTLANKPYSQFTGKDWETVNTSLKPFADQKVSSVLYSYNDEKIRKEKGDFYNANMENFVYYDSNGVIGENANNVYSGSELRALGFNIDKGIGEMSSTNIIPQRVAGTPYTFAKPEVVTIKDQSSKGAQLYVGKNRAQIDNNYIIDVLQNGISQASQVRIPTELFPGSNIIVIPKGDYQYTIKLPDNTAINVEAKNPTELREAAINIYNSSSAIQNLIMSNLFESK